MDEDHAPLSPAPSSSSQLNFSAAAASSTSFSPTLSFEPLLASDIKVAYVDNNKLHVQLSSTDSIRRCTAIHSFLTRCGTESNLLRNSHPCGPLKHAIEEVLKFEFQPADTAWKADKPKLVREFTSAINKEGIETTAVWLKATNEEWRGNAPLTIYAVPRVWNKERLRHWVETMSGKFNFLGVSVTVQAPNMPEFIHCNCCGLLGHKQQDCSLYKGIAIRFVMKDRIGYGTLITDLITAAGATAGYLGSGMEQRASAYFFTLLFDSAEMLAVKLSPFIASLKSRMSEAPRKVNPRSRLTDCSTCGSEIKSHM